MVVHDLHESTSVVAFHAVLQGGDGEPWQPSAKKSEGESGEHGEDGPLDPLMVLTMPFVIIHENLAAVSLAYIIFHSCVPLEVHM